MCESVRGVIAVFADLVILSVLVVVFGAIIGWAYADLPRNQFCKITAIPEVGDE